MATGPAHALPARPAEQLLIERLDTMLDATRLATAWCGTLGRAQLAGELARRQSACRVICPVLDLFAAEHARQAQTGVANLEVVCQPDPPELEYDLVALPCSSQGDGELTREFVQTAADQLRLHGQLWAATDNPRDRWLRETLEQRFDHVSGWSVETGTIYRAVKNKPLRKRKRYDAEYAFRDGERLLKVWSRPGVFSHRHLDTGARALIEVMQIEAGERVVDIGCGAGVVSLAAASRAANVTVLAVDSNPRAIECTRRNAVLNELPQIRAELDAEVGTPAARQFDVVLANPPYYSRHRIAELFVDGAARALRSAGRMYLVTKEPQWYLDNLSLDDWDEIRAEASRAYAVVSTRRQ